VAKKGEIMNRMRIKLGKAAPTTAVGRAVPEKVVNVSSDRNSLPGGLGGLMGPD